MVFLLFNLIFSTNIAYKFSSIQIPSFFRIKSLSQQSKLHINLLGKQFKSQTQAKQYLKSIIWFTYRSHFKISQQLTSDTGWGCLLRVGQMILASAIKRYFQYKINYQLNQDTIHNIIYAFLDDEGSQQKYSVLSMMKIAQNQFNLKPGQWFNIAQIGYLLQKIQNKRPMKGTNDLKIMTFNQSVIFLQQIYSVLNIPLCKCKIKKIKCNICHSFSQIKNQQEQNIIKNNNLSNKLQHQQDNLNQNFNKEEQQLNKHLLIIVVARLSIKVIPKESYQGLLQFLTHHTSLGIMGGVPKKALYFTGRFNDQLIYLDPHYVHQSVNRKNFRKNVISFSCQQFRTLQRSQVDPSMGFCFYIRKLSDLQSLTQFIEKLKQQKKNDFLSIMWENAFGMKKQEQYNQNCFINGIQNDDQDLDEQQNFKA